jgi:hypothetical protein
VAAFTERFVSKQKPILFYLFRPLLLEVLSEGVQGKHAVFGMGGDIHAGYIVKQTPALKAGQQNKICLAGADPTLDRVHRVVAKVFFFILRNTK